MHLPCCCGRRGAVKQSRKVHVASILGDYDDGRVEESATLAPAPDKIASTAKERKETRERKARKDQTTKGERWRKLGPLLFPYGVHMYLTMRAGKSSVVLPAGAIQPASECKLRSNNSDKLQKGRQL